MTLHRRRFLAQGAAATWLAGVSGAAFASRFDPFRSADGGQALRGTVTRARFGCTATTVHADIGSIDIPRLNVVYELPLSQTFFNEAPADFTLLSNGQVQVNATGLYRAAMCVDWPGQDGTDNHLRYYGICSQTALDPLLPYTAGQLTNTAGARFDRMGIYDAAGSNPPVYARFPLDTSRNPGSFAWSPGTVPAHGDVTIDVTLADLGIVVPGDVAQAGLSSLSLSRLGSAKFDALSLDARVVRGDVVRVFLRNASDGDIAVPAGNLWVIAGSTKKEAGGQADTWTVIQTPTLRLKAGDRLFGVFKSKWPGDYIQVSDQSYLMVERW